MPDWPLSQRLREYLEVQYDLREVLGQGGMGVVLLATERVLDRPVAIKVLHRHAAEQPELRERFRREARVAARLTHPNIVPLHAFGDVDGELFFVMGYVEGETLAARLRRPGRVPPDEALRILRELCDALALAHANGIVHRDIKPENVLIEARSGRALLADFGIARESTAGADSAGLTGTGIVVGTPHYMSPEQASSDATVDHRADIYSVGVLGYRMLTGRLPFDGANVLEVLAQQMTATPRDLVREEPDIAPQIAAAVMRCLEKDPPARWPDAAALRDAIATTGQEIDELPDDLAGLDGALPKTALVGLIGTWIGLQNHYWWHNELLGEFVPMAIWGAPLGALMMLLYSIRNHGWRHATAVLCRAPRSWTLWWPRWARRPGDVWDRLPRALRWARVMMYGGIALATIGFGAVLVLFTTVSPEELADFLEHPLVKQGMPILAGVAAGGILGGALTAHYWWRSTGRKSPLDAQAPWLSAPASGPFWKRPEIAQYLLPATATAHRMPDSAERLASGIADAVKVLVRAGTLRSGEPAAAAIDVVTVIEAIDKELAMLAKGGDAEELRRLDHRIAAFGVADSGHVVEMLKRQREAVHAIVERQTEQRQRRERLLAQLRELYVAVEQLRQRADAAAGVTVTGRLDVACADLRRLAAGYDELGEVAPTPVASRSS